MKRFILFILLYALIINPLWSKTEMDSVFQVLFQVMHDSKVYMAAKEQQINNTIQLLHTPDLSDNQIYSIYNQLHHEYNTYKIDSAIYYGEKNIIIAEKLKNQEYIYETKVDLSFSYWLEGRFLEALNLLDNLDRKSFDNLPEHLLINYYQSYKRLFIYYASGDKNNPYYAISNLYRDSLFTIVPSGTHCLLITPCLSKNAQRCDSRLL
jgi:hypothetical protein